MRIWRQSKNVDHLDGVQVAEFLCLICNSKAKYASCPFFTLFLLLYIVCNDLEYNVLSVNRELPQYSFRLVVISA